MSSACRLSARRRASVVLPTPIGPSTTMYRGGSSLRVIVLFEDAEPIVPASSSEQRDASMPRHAHGRRDLRERYEHEVALVQMRMGEHERSFLQLAAVVEEQIEIEGAGAPSRPGSIAP